MGRLIDADELMKDIEKSMANNPHEDSKVASVHNHEHRHFMTIVAKQPTAYDVDKVQDEIKAQFGCKDCEYVDEFQHPACNECAELEVINDICDIVRRGGVNAI